MTETVNEPKAKQGPQAWPVAKLGELAPGDRKLVEIKRHSIGLFNVNGEYVAALNMCPHELAPVCKGRVGGTTLPSKPGEFIWGREGEILACPWHGWEFDLLTGHMLADDRVRIRRYPVTIEGDDIYITV
jgi:3-phenylpropionate/trans-cinnamate dioxygenase ferredoxin subunit